MSDKPLNDILIKVAFKEGALALAHYIYNTDRDTIVHDIYGDKIHPSYFEEKLKQWCDNPIRAIGYLDEDHRSKLFDAVLSYHVKTMKKD